MVRKVQHSPQTSAGISSTCSVFFDRCVCIFCCPPSALLARDSRTVAHVGPTATSLLYVGQHLFRHESRESSSDAGWCSPDSGPSFRNRGHLALLWPTLTERGPSSLERERFLARVCPMYALIGQDATAFGRLRSPRFGPDSTEFGPSSTNFG